MFLRKLRSTYHQYKSVRNSLKFNATHKKAFTLTEMEQKYLNEIREKGYAVVENYYSKEECEAVIKEIDRLFAEYPQYQWKDPYDADHRIYGANRISPIIRKFYDDPFLNKMASAFNEMETINNHTLVGRIEAKEKNIGSGQGWHRDSVSPYQFKSLMYLTDVDADHGPFEYLEGTHKISSLFHGIWKVGTKQKQYRITEEEIDGFVKTGKYKRSVLTGKAGTLVLVNTFGIHRGTPINKGVRYALTNYFYNKFGLKDTYFEGKFNLPPKNDD